MPKSKKTRHGSGKPHRAKSPVYAPVYTDQLAPPELRAALKEKLSLQELIELEKQVRKLVEDASMKASAKATEEAYERQFAVMMRVMRDRFGFGRKRLRHLWEMCLEYIHDIDDHLLTTKEMLDTLEREDGIRLSWKVQL